MRQMCMNQMTELKGFADRASADATSKLQFKIMYEQLETIQTDFKRNHQGILSLVATQEDANIDAEEASRKEFEYDFSYVYAVHSSLFQEKDEKPQIAPVESCKSKTPLRLPKIEIPKFSGEFINFRPFHDLYKSLIHEDESLSEVSKFNYLISFLEGSPLELIQHIPRTTENYNTAYQTIIDRYDSPRVIAFAHLQAIYVAPIITGAKNLNLLREIIDTFTKNIAAIRNLGFNTEDWDFLLFFLLSKHLDDDTKTKFEVEMNLGRSQIPSYDSLKKFILKLCNARETVDLTDNKLEFENKRVPKGRNFGLSKIKHTFFANAQAGTSTNKINCAFCNASHHTYKCFKFRNMSPNQRFNIAKTNNWCSNCLSNQHSTANCKSQSTCRFCHHPHHSLVHISRSSPTPNAIASNAASPDVTAATGAAGFADRAGEVTPHESNIQNKPSSSVHAENIINTLYGLTPIKKNILLATAIVEVLDSRGMPHRVRALIDSGSEANYISQRCFNKLHLSRYSVTLTINGLNNMTDTTSRGGVICTIRPKNKSAPPITFDAFILKELCKSFPRIPISSKSWSHISGIDLADDKYFEPSCIDVLLGAEIFPYILQDGRLLGNANEPVALNSVFGWLLMGKYESSEFSHATTLFSTHNEDIDNFALDKIIKKFWETEEPPRIQSISPEDTLCENIFLNTFNRSESGRYVVDLPFKDATEPIFDGKSSLDIARRRFFALERRLARAPELAEEYSKVFKEYLDVGYLEQIPSHSKNGENYYVIPHHCITRPGKFRIVYDASAKTAQGFSLNDTLLTGKKLHKDIVTVLLNFRVHTIAFTCDIKGMFNQIKLTGKHQNYQRVLWRFSEKDPLKQYKFNRVIFGLACSPFLANRTILQLARDEQQEFPLASEILKKDIYVDDIVTGSSSLENAKIIKSQLINMLKSAGFELRKWSSNKPELLLDLPQSHIYTKSICFDEESEMVKILGLRWDSKQDVFSFNVNPVDRQCTKRNILSEIARVYDPLGLLAPVTIQSKCLMQVLWTLGLHWDEAPPRNICDTWTQRRKEFSLLSQLKIPRQMSLENCSDFQIHGFCDASEKAYASVIYLRAKHTDGTFKTSFVISKSKVAPLKSISIPRLELTAAALLANLISFVVSAFNDIKISKICAWTDSSITLSWIKSHAYRWKTFVRNRVADIQDKVPPDSWHHVSSQDNPSDCASRGISPAELLQNDAWWAGPPWLAKDARYWPATSFVQNTDDYELEQRKITFTSTISENVLNTLLENFSSFSKLQRVCSYVLCFIKKLKSSTPREIKIHSLVELKNSTTVLVKYVQESHFFEEISNLKISKSIPKYLQKLGAFLDSQGVLRVGGRLQNATLTFDQKHPIILPRKSRFTQLVIEHFHRLYLHPGIQTLQFLISQQFWILSPKRAIREVVSKCTKCWKLAPKAYQPYMGNLPKLRVSQLKAFSCVGIDFAGPFFITMSRIRGAKTLKAYVSVFICFSTKAIHLELASDLSSDAFLAAFRRFLSRRGRCLKIYSDCGTNFVGANKQLISFMKHAAHAENIEWHFNPPSAPHFSGLAEAGVKSVKTHLRRVIGCQILTFEGLYTVLVQIEALLNSRPLCPVSADVKDLSVLTPGHFLNLDPISTIPQDDLSQLKLNHLDRWQLLQRLQQDFWAKWHAEYLHTLQQRSKWLKPDSPPPKVGAIVLIKNEPSPPLTWHIGKIVDLHPGDDGIARVATVYTKEGTFKRPLVKLCPLPNIE